MTAVLLSLATFVSTMLGGLLALKFRDRLYYALSFTAGVLLGVVSFDILPEAHSQEHPATAGLIALTCLGAAFIFFALRLAE